MTLVAGLLHAAHRLLKRAAQMCSPAQQLRARAGGRSVDGDAVRHAAPAAPRLSRQTLETYDGEVRIFDDEDTLRLYRSRSVLGALLALEGEGIGHAERPSK